MSRQINIIGAGNLGANIACFLSEHRVGNRICVYDSSDGRAQGKTLDMIESQPIRRTLPYVYSIDSLADANDAAITFVTLSTDISDSRAPMSNPDVQAEVKNIARYLQGYRGIVVVTPPCEQELPQLLHQQAQLDADKIIGLGTLPHTMYAKYLISRELNVDSRQIQIPIVGSATQPKILIDMIRIASIPYKQIYTEIDFHALLVENIEQFALDASKNYYRTAVAAALIAEAIDSNLRRILSVASIVAAQHYGLKQHCFAAPSVISADGVSIPPFAQSKHLTDIYHSIAKVN